MPWNRPLIICLLAVVLVLAWWHGRPDQNQVRRTRLLMGTTVEVVALGENEPRLEQAVSAAFSEMERLDKLLSSHQPESDPARINRSVGDPIEVAEETAAVLALALDVAGASSGAFDPTLGRLQQLWDIGGEQPRVPAADAIAVALATRGIAALDLSGRQVRKRKSELHIDLGGVAKGYIIDRAIQILRQQGVQQAAVNAGGDMYLLGQHGDRPWRVGIQHPRQQQAVVATLALQDRAVVTSGDYERFFEQGGVRYHHLFDPQTGYPATACQSVTVVADSAALADALATALFVLGPEQGLALLRQYPGSEALLITASGEAQASPGWAAHQTSP